MKLDYTLETPEERVQLVSQLVQENPNLSSTYLDNLTDYILLAASKQERKQKQILTENRLATINKRETSYEGLAATLENGEDGIAVVGVVIVATAGNQAQNHSCKHCYAKEQ